MSSATISQQLAQQSSPQTSSPSALAPLRFFQSMHAYQQTAALKAAIDLDLFSAIDDQLPTVAEIAHRTHASERGVRGV